MENKIRFRISNWEFLSIEQLDKIEEYIETYSENFKKLPLGLLEYVNYHVSRSQLLTDDQAVVSFRAIVAITAYVYFEENPPFDLDNFITKYELVEKFLNG